MSNSVSTIKKATLTGKTPEERIVEWRKTEERKLLLEAADKAGEVFRDALAEADEYELRKNKWSISTS